MLLIEWSLFSTKKISSPKRHFKFLLLFNLILLTACHSSMSNKENPLPQTIDLSQAPLEITILKQGNLIVLLLKLRIKRS